VGPEISQCGGELASGLDACDPILRLAPEVLRVICTTNAIESVNTRLRKIIKTRGHFPTDDAATKLIWLALRNITEDWGRAANNWKTADESVCHLVRRPLYKNDQIK
jgi:transposase-like protein